MNFQDTIKKYAIVQKKQMGGPEVTQELTDDQAKGLREDLNAISARNGRIFWTVLILIICLFVASVIFVVINQTKPDTIKLIFGITGVSVMGLILYMVKIWKEKNYIDLTLTLVRTLDKTMINSILNALLQKL
jgi:hypothetical protein